MKFIFEKVLTFIFGLVFLWLLFMFLGWAWDHKGAIFMLIAGIVVISIVFLLLSNSSNENTSIAGESLHVDNEQVPTPVSKVMKTSLENVQYPALCECEFDENENSRYFVSFRDIPEANVEGSTLSGAVNAAKESLSYTANMYKIRGDQLPISSKATADEIMITL